MSTCSWLLVQRGDESSHTSRTRSVWEPHVLQTLPSGSEGRGLAADLAAGRPLKPQLAPGGRPRRRQRWACAHCGVGDVHPAQAAETCTSGPPPRPHLGPRCQSACLGRRAAHATLCSAARCAGPGPRCSRVLREGTWSGHLTPPGPAKLGSDWLLVRSPRGPTVYP